MNNTFLILNLIYLSEEVNNPDTSFGTKFSPCHSEIWFQTIPDQSEILFAPRLMQIA